MSQIAVVNYSAEPHSVELREIDEPKIGPEEVLLEVAAVGVCGLIGLAFGVHPAFA